MRDYGKSSSYRSIQVYEPYLGENEAYLDRYEP